MTYPPPQGSLSLTAILEAVYPVGAIYESYVSTSPATLFGFGTWETFGAGRVVVGLDSADADFDTPGETRGAKTHTLTTDEMPAHTHSTSAAGSFHANPGTDGSSTHWMFDGGYVNPGTGSSGGGGAHNNLQPSIVAYRWRRTA